MIYLALAILFSSAINWIFKLFDRFEINTKYAIPFNYLTCSIVGQVLAKQFVFSSKSIESEGFVFTICLGLLFIFIFYAMAKTTTLFGIAVNAVSAKMAMVIPTLFFLIYLQEKIGIWGILGILLAILAVLFINYRDLKISTKKTYLLFPLMVFIGSGIIDTCMKWIDIQYLRGNSPIMATTQIFTGAFILGLVWMVSNRFKNLKTRDIFGGIALGIPNFFSIYFLITAIQKLSTWNTASIFTSNNIAVILLSTLGGIVLFKDRINSLQWFGLALSLLSILMMQYAV